MSEFREGHTISKIIGSPPGYIGYSDNNYVLNKIKSNPYSIVLLDEIEKAHPDVLKLFLQVLDDGYMTNSLGEKIDFSHTIIFMTSNLGMSTKNIGFFDNTNVVVDKFKSFLGVEFVNRIDKIVYFDDINDKVISKIIKARAEELGFDTLKISTEFVDKVKGECNYCEFGARHVDKVLNKYLNNFVNTNH